MVGLLGPIPLVFDLITTVTGKKFSPSACIGGCFVQATPQEQIAAAISVGLTAAAYGIAGPAAAAVPGAVRTAAQLEVAQRLFERTAAAISGEANRKALKDGWEKVKKALNEAGARVRAKKLSDEIKALQGERASGVRDIPPEAIAGKTREEITNRALSWGLLPATTPKGEEVYLDPVTGLSRIAFVTPRGGPTGAIIADVYGRRVNRAGELVFPGEESRPDATFELAR